MKKNPVQTKAVQGNIDFPLVALNIFLLVVSAATLFLADAAINKNTREAALNANTFLTTEWRLLKELKGRTDRLLQDKDREIAELRLRYEALQANRSSGEELAALEEEIRRAESEREGILAVRFSPKSSPAAPETGAVRESSGILSLAAPDTPVAALLRGQILELEKEIAAGRKDTVNLERQIGELRERLKNALTREDAAPAVVATPVVDAAAQSELKEASGRDDILALLEKDRESLAALDPVLSLADIKTRSLLRAIVRTPAIRAEYPDLSASLDRYFDLYGRAERLKGKREAYDEAIRSVGSIKEW